MALPVTDPVLVPVHKVDGAHRAGLQFPVAKDEGFAGPEEGAPDVGVAVENGSRVRRELRAVQRHEEIHMLGARVAVVHVLCHLPGDDAVQNPVEVHLQKLVAVIVPVVDKLLENHGAGGVLGLHHAETVLHAAFGNDLPDLFGDVVVGGPAAVGCDHYGIVKCFHVMLLHYIRASRAFTRASIISIMAASGSLAATMPLVAPVPSAPDKMAWYTFSPVLIPAA